MQQHKEYVTLADYTIERDVLDRIIEENREKTMQEIVETVRRNAWLRASEMSA